MADQQPGYWAVIPAEVLRDTVIPANAKLLFGDISTLTRANGYCYATTAYFADLYGWSERTVYRLLKALEDQGHIEIETISGEERRIYCGRYLPRGTPDKIVRGQRQKCQGPPDNFVKSNKDDKDIDNIPPLPPNGGTVGSLYDLMLEDGTTYQVTEADMAKWRSRFPAVDVEQQFRSMAAWLEVNPERRKTRRGIGRFIFNWLSKRVDKPPVGSGEGGGGIGDLVL